MITLRSFSLSLGKYGVDLIEDGDVGLPPGEVEAGRFGVADKVIDEHMFLFELLD